MDDCGRCVVAEEVLDKDGNPFERPLWKCTEECKHPTEDEVACICRVKAMFKQPVQQVREGFKGLDIGCPHLHRTLPPTVYSSDSDDDEEREHVPPVHDGDADDGDHWMGHPFPCSSMGSCGSQLRIISAAAVHYPLLRKFLNLLYLARWHHRRVLNLDNALCSADFRELMKLTDIESYGALYKGSKGESGCACENSTPGLPNLEP